jgi:hypothetical protein
MNNNQPPHHYDKHPVAAIAKCAGFRCTERASCHRFVRPAASVGQRYIEYWREKKGKNCSGYAVIEIKRPVGWPPRETAYAAP